MATTAITPLKGGKKHKAKARKTNGAKPAKIAHSTA